MARKVSVGLEADVAGFIGPVDAAAHATEKLDHKVDELDRSIGKITPDALKAGAGLTTMGDSADRASNKTDKLRDSSSRFAAAGTTMAETAHRAKDSVDGLKDKVDGLDHALDKIPADAARAAAAMKLLSGDVKDVSTNFQAVGDRSSAMTILDSRIRNTRAEVKKLGEEFTRTGDIDVFKKLGRASGDLSALTGFRKTLSNSVETGLKDGVEKGGPAAARTFSSMFQGGIIDAFMGLPPELKLVVVNVAAAIGVSLASLIGAMIHGALLGALGGGVLAVGIALQASDPRVRTAFGQLGASIARDLNSATSGFAKPLVYAAHAFGKAWNEEFPGIKAGFEWISKFIVPLSDGLAKAFKNMQPGFLAAIQSAGPILQAIADELPQFGKVLSKAFADLAKNSKGAEDGIRTLFFIVETLILGVSKAISVLSGMYHSLVQISAAAVDAGAALLGWVPIIGPALQKASKNFHDTAAGANHVASGLHDLAVNAGLIPPAADDVAASIGKISTAFSQVGQSIQGAFTSQILNGMFAVDHATFRWEESLNSLSDAVKQNGRSLSGHSEKVLRNKEALLAAAEANGALYAQNLLAGDSAAVAGKKYEANAAQLRKQAIAAGFNAGEVDKLIGKYGNVPSRVQTILATIGLTEALNHLAQILIDFRNLNNKDFKTKYTITTVHVNTFTSSGNLKTGQSRLGGGLALGGIRHAAEGMIVGPSNPGTLIAEPQTGGEALIPLRGLTQHAAMGLMRTTGAGYGLDVVPRGGGMARFEHTFVFDNASDSVMGSAISLLFRTGKAQVTSRAIVN